ncbi:MAG: hypothetical protein IKX45_07360 [Bacteroidales bacterium]|nr:hypothetical protein [Bacteroidales bacterium]
MKRLSIMLLILCGCSPEPRLVPGISVDAGYTRIEFKRTKVSPVAGDAGMSEFHYLTYDYSLGSWSGELGGMAVRNGDVSDPFLPADASRVYWPEGKIYSFYAAGYNDALPVDEEDVEYGTAVMLYSSGTTSILNIKNQKHNVDWMAAKVLHQEKIDGIPLQFRHIFAKVSTLNFNLESYKAWIEERELDIADIVSLSCTLSDVDEQTYVFSPGAQTLFNRESFDYRASPAQEIAGRLNLNLSAGESSAEISYYAFPGKHMLTMHIQAVDVFGNQVVDDRVLSGEITLPMGADCNLDIVLNPDVRNLDISLGTSVAAWESGGSGNVIE